MNQHRLIKCFTKHLYREEIRIYLSLISIVGVMLINRRSTVNQVMCSRGCPRGPCSAPLMCESSRAEPSFSHAWLNSSRLCAGSLSVPGTHVPLVQRSTPPSVSSLQEVRRFGNAPRASCLLHVRGSFWI